MIRYFKMDLGKFGILKKRINSTANHEQSIYAGDQTAKWLVGRMD
jgi:hypothetical protein